MRAAGTRCGSVRSGGSVHAFVHTLFFAGLCAAFKMLYGGCRFFSVFNASRGRLGVLRLFESTIPHQSNEIRT